MDSQKAARADLAAIYAGGAGKRMGGADKGKLVVGGEPLWKAVSSRLTSQAAGLAVVSHVPPDWLDSIPGGAWIADMPNRAGPAAGLMAALRHLDRARGRDALLLTSPIDAPFLPPDLFQKLDGVRRSKKAPAAIVFHKTMLHPVFGLWTAGCADDVSDALKDERSLAVIAQRIGAAECEAWVGAQPDPFMNINTPEDLAAAEQAARGA